jgi:hypothetical protein
MKKVVLRLENRIFTVPESCNVTLPENCKVDMIYQDNGEIFVIEVKSNSELNKRINLDTYQKEHNNEILRLKLPNVDEIRNFIKTRNDYAHDIRQVSRYFLGREIIVTNRDDKENKKLYDILWRRIEKVRKKINSEEHGKWINKKQGFSKPNIYFFVKNGINKEK